jgi:hypothetical protein
MQEAHARVLVGAHVEGKFLQRKLPEKAVWPDVYLYRENPYA